MAVKTFVKIGDITFTVKFEDGEKKPMTAEEIGKLKDKRRYVVENSKGEPVLTKTYRGI